MKIFTIKLLKTNKKEKINFVKAFIVNSNIIGLLLYCCEIFENELAIPFYNNFMGRLSAMIQVLLRFRFKICSNFMLVPSFDSSNTNDVLFQISVEF